MSKRCLYLICIVHFWWRINASCSPQSGNIKYHNIAFDASSGLQFSRPYPVETVTPTPIANLTQPEEIAGIAIFDYDNDGDLDIFVSNGPGLRHSLFQNQLEQTGDLEFIDVADNAGFDQIAINQKGAGVCFGDIDNDGCTDLLVVGHQSPNLLYVNKCDGTFIHTPNNGIYNNTLDLRGSSCSFGDINNDGLIDVVIGNSGNLDNAGAVSNDAFSSTPFRLFEPNELYLNNGDNTFTDLSAEIQALRFSIGNESATIYDGNATLTWAVTMVDINNDGWIDIVEINDQFGPINNPEGTMPAAPRGINQIWYNSGNLTFETIPFAYAGSWMGVAQGDLNCDGKLDLFVSNFGSYGRETITSISAFGPQFALNYPTRWFFQDDDANGNFAPDTNNITNYDFVSPFGFGAAIMDYDNDGDFDILVHGGLDASFFGKIGDNPGTLWENKDGCFAQFEMIDPETEIFDIDPLCVQLTGAAGCTYHSSRNVYALAIGDLDNDGFYDIVTTSANSVNLSNISNVSFGIAKGDSILDKTAFRFPPYQSIKQQFQVVLDGPLPLPGDLFVEVSSGNRNNYIKITAKGSKGICLVNGNVNRDGIGAILKVNHMIQAITGGESMAAGNSFEKIFGLGRYKRADLEIFWPKPGGGYIKNRLLGIFRNSALTIYEIPCDYETRNNDIDTYELCVERSIDSLFYHGFISKYIRKTFKRSMLFYN